MEKNGNLLKSIWKFIYNLIAFTEKRIMILFTFKLGKISKLDCLSAKRGSAEKKPVKP
jgi:hypothetical protein